MTQPLFSSYRTGENRVTSSMLAVFERLDLALVEELLGTAAREPLKTVSFKNQVSTTTSVPDACISARFTWWFETKTVNGAYRSDGQGRLQVREHASLLRRDEDAYLFVLTPDPAAPAWFSDLDGVDPAVRGRVRWIGFRDLAETIRGVTVDPARLIGEQSRFLLGELVALFENEGLLTSDDTVVVAARNAWPEYQRFGAYVCQPDRAFRDGLTHFGFYTDQEIKPLVARIRARHPAISFTRENAQAWRTSGDDGLGAVIDWLLDEGTRVDGEAYGVVLLSLPDDPDTVHLEHPIRNNTVTESGRTWAWTLGQRYTSVDRLSSGCRWTSDL